MPVGNRIHRIGLKITCLGWLVLCSSFAPPASAIDNVSELNLEDLLQVEVTTAARQPEGLYDTAAAVFVITQEDIRRSGATSLPELLRMVPGLQVARINNSVWAITARGLNSRFANELLVLQDGRTLYNHLFSGVYWNAQDTILADIDRIEVIRGAGAALWGANAVNGVINIITRPAAETQGSLQTLTVGNEERFIAEARQGAKLGEGRYLRLYAKAFERDSGSLPQGVDDSDDWRVQRAGFRLDQELQGNDSLTVLGDLYRGEAGETFKVGTTAPPYRADLTDDTTISGGNLLARWQRTYSADSDLRLQIFYDLARNSDLGAGQTRQTYDVDFQHRFRPAPGQKIVWGLGYRRYHDRTKKGAIISFDPDRENLDLWTAFLNDRITLVRDELALIVGSQVERNDYTGFEWQPTLRLLWTPRPYFSFWASANRSVRTPSRAENAIDLRRQIVPVTSLPSPLNGLGGPAIAQYALIGNPDFAAETVWSYEIGGRCQPRPDLYLELVLFHAVYDGLRNADLAAPVNEGDRWLLPLVGNNRLDAKTWGSEVSVDWVVRPWWKLQGAYTYLNVLLELDPDATYTGFRDGADNNPHHQFSLRSKMDLGNSWEWDLWLRLVDNLPASGIGGYGALDTRLAWEPKPGWRFELVGQNLLDPHHPEYESDALNASVVEVDRSFMVRITRRF